MSGDPKDNNSKLFKEGAMEYIKIVTDQAVDNWDPKNAFKIVEDSLIANNNNIDAILALSDTIAGATIEALQAQGLAGKVSVTEQDANLIAVQRIVQLMTIFKDSRELVKSAIDAAIKLANGEEGYTNSKENNGKIDVH